MSVMKVKKNMTKDFSRMDAPNRAMCYALRNPPKGGTPMKLEQIQQMVFIFRFSSQRNYDRGCGRLGSVCVGCEAHVSWVKILNIGFDGKQYLENPNIFSDFIFFKNHILGLDT